MKSILIVDDDKNICELLKRMTKDFGNVFIAYSGKEALDIIAGQKIDLVFLDLQLLDSNGLDILKKIKGLSKEIIVIMITGHMSMESVIEATKYGAFDYIAKPFDGSEVELILSKAFRIEKISGKNNAGPEKEYDPSSMFGKSKQILEVFKIIAKASKLKSTVLIYGQSGTGKELVARNIHFNSAGTGKPFVAIDCVSLSPSLLENELFGHEKGSFTGADDIKKGRFEMASGGTLFLDEISNMPHETQAKLLRVLQEKEIYRVGGTKPIEIDVRIIVATNKDLREEIKEGRFREDLFYRLNVLQINLPSLKERKEDIPLLAEAFFKQYSRELGFKLEAGEGTMEMLTNYSWPGNIRELKNVIEQCVVMAKGGSIFPEDLPDNIKNYENKNNGNNAKESTFNGSIEEMEISMLKEALRKAENNQTKTAQILGIDRGKLKYKLAKYGIKTK